MKIGIITQPLINNYGGILQNYALQTILKRIGCVPITLNQEHTPLELSRMHFIASYFKRLLRRLSGEKQMFLNPLKEDRYVFTTCPSIKKFIDKYISKIDVKDDLMKCPELTRSYDGFVVGSDQIWRPLYSPNILNLFLDFASDATIKVAYAASFGTDVWEYSSSLAEKAKLLIKRFNGISVREKSGVNLCKANLDADAVHVLDPTLLLSKDDYVSLCPKVKNLEKYIAVYLLDKNKSKIKAVERIAKNANCKIRYIGERSFNDCQSIECWLSSILGSEFVITDSFHGSVFSIIFNRPFITFYNRERGNARLESLLSDFDLLDNLVIPESHIEINREVDWNKVNNKIRVRKEISLKFLKNALYEK